MTDVDASNLPNFGGMPKSCTDDSAQNNEGLLKAQNAEDIVEKKAVHGKDAQKSKAKCVLLRVTRKSPPVTRKLPSAGLGTQRPPQALVKPPKCRKQL